MISNSQVAHNFAHNVKENLKSGSMFWESRNDGTRRIYSYGHHFCIAIIYPNDIVLFTTRGYSNTTAKHINFVARALYQNNIIYVNDPEGRASSNIDHYLNDIKTAFYSLKKSRARAKFYINNIDSLYDNAVKYSTLTGEPFTPVLTAIYNEYRAYIANPEFIARLNEQEAARRAKAERIEAERVERERVYNLSSAERVAEWENGKNIYLTYNDTADNVPMRITTRKGYTVIETGKGVIVPMNEAKRVAALVLSESLNDLIVNSIYHIREYNADSVQIGCHRFKMDYLKEWAEKVKAL